MNETQPVNRKPALTFFPRDRSFWLAVALTILVFVFFVVFPLSPYYRTRSLYISVGGLIIDLERRFSSGGMVSFLLLLVWVLIGGVLVGTCRSLYARIWTILILFAATGMMAISVFFGIWWFAVYRPLAGTVLDNTWYHLEYQSNFDNNRYLLIQCNSQDMDCKGLDTDIPNVYSPSQYSELVANPETNTLSVVIDGETIYTYTPED